MVKILISGICGHMGRNVLELAREDKDIECVGGVDLQAGELCGVPVYDSLEKVQDTADAVIDFSSASNLENLLAYAKKTGTALILAATGYTGEQLAAMEMMGVDPVRRIMAPRFAGVMISMPVLAMIFSTMGIIGAWVVGVGLIGTDNGAFWSQMQGGVDFYTDVLNGVVKSVVFGVAVGLIALFQGYSARPTPDGVSRATTRTVVISSLMVLGLDFIMTAFMFSGI